MRHLIVVLVLCLLAQLALAVPTRTPAGDATLPPPIANLTGKWGCYEITQNGRHLVVNSGGDMPGYGSIQDDGTILIFWYYTDSSRYQNCRAQISVYRLSKCGDFLEGRWTEIDKAWNINAKGNLTVLVHYEWACETYLCAGNQHTMHRTQP